MVCFKSFSLSKIVRNIGIYKNYFWNFYNKQNEKVQLKIDWTIDVIRTTQIVPKKIFKKMKGTGDIWEIRVSANKGIFRIFCFFDGGDLVVLLSGFQKKSQKTPKKEIKLAERLKKEYYEEK